MKAIQRSVAMLQLVLIAPAVLFLAAVLARSLSPVQVGPAQQIVNWYAGRVWTLWVLLIALPLGALVAGGAALLWSSQQQPAPRSQLARRISVAATVASGLILVVVGLHVLAN